MGKEVLSRGGGDRCVKLVILISLVVKAKKSRSDIPSPPYVIPSGELSTGHMYFALFKWKLYANVTLLEEFLNHSSRLEIT
jgi:hypothetical protein